MKNSKSNICLKITVCCPHSCVDVWMRGREADHIFADIGNLLDSSERGLCKACEETKLNGDATSHMHCFPKDQKVRKSGFLSDPVHR